MRWPWALKGEAVAGTRAVAREAEFRRRVEELV